MRTLRKFTAVIFCGLLLLIFSCGMEDYLYLNYVDEGGIQLPTPNTTATIKLPSFNTAEYYYFTHFSFFYRIYISDSNSIATYPYEQSVLSGINSTLYNDFSALSYYTSSETTITNNLASQFSSRRYYPLELQNAGIEGVLSASSLGRQITLDFSNGRAPVLILSDVSNIEDLRDSQTHTLRRTGGDGIFFPVPSDLLFFNTQDLNSSANATALINNDVADKSGVTGQRHTYVSIYIVTTGRDANLTPVYSRPTHVGVFYLPAP
jgi:hypothetical protein